MRPGIRALLTLCLSVTTALPAAARTHRVEPGRSVAEAMRAAAAGDTVLLLQGLHRGPVRVDRAVHLRGETGTLLHGEDKGTVVEVVAPGAVVEDIEIQGSGDRALTIDSGIHLILAHNAIVRRVRMKDVLYGVYAERSHGVRIEDCVLEGRVPPLTEIGTGNGIHLWYSNDAQIVGATIERFLDGIYLSFAHRADVSHSHLRSNGRYGLHTMYCQQNRLADNLFTNNVAGCAIMFSNHLRIENNDVLHNRGPRTYGFLLRDCSDGLFENNRMVNNTIAMFMDNSNRNVMRGNLLQDNGWGVLMFSSCDGNVVHGNSFINNDYPVALDMRRSDNAFDDGVRGNYWSDNAPYDLDGDGLSDVEYSPVGTFAFLSKQFPDLAILAKSPAVAALSVAERIVPALRPSELVDHHPLLEPVAVSGMGDMQHRDAPGPAWVSLFAFALVALFGIGGLRRGWRSR